ncbi:hypothetical protein KRE40_07830 [Elizabethkingia meningoseptica]|uniref:hypothetical protein n=1 Tax=Elizabethkingia meningoseptica TaxID=238 RepID=UPI00099ABC6E|nr:hypothetical protein [Elizabethkingia meningoseptica]MDE5438015.1 hypothetical protein [Elizabethkingia meningoseptica]MDE5492139.1 hypothetical protein [Elizabethkingia meningoseptica]MDE5508558.1 hypothetical protein [Elizabethkingia meningoseptica]MDE5516082.1 hypothetical protein [Elizabethkingia meningoseptica]MDE5526941.1 hypothetical protein [Elizabethkingia meningoseptica]
MNNLKDKLEVLKKRNIELSTKIFVDFNTSEELQKYRNENIDIFNEYQDNLEQIRELEWELMTPEQQARDIEVRRLIRLKTGQIKEDEE